MKILKKIKVENSEFNNSEDIITKKKVTGGIPFYQNMFTIRAKLIFSFVVPIIFIIILGVVSFQTAATAIRNQYKASATDTIAMTGKYMQYGFKGVLDTSLLYMTDLSIENYIYSKGTDAFEHGKRFDMVSNMINTKQMTDDFIENIYLAFDESKPISTKSNVSEEIYDTIKNSEIEKLLNDHNDMIWMGKESTIDEALDSNSAEYALRLIRKFSTINGLVIIDISKDTIKTILQELNFNEKGFIGMVTADGSEISYQDFSENIFSDKEFYRNAVSSEESSGSEYVTYNSKEYLFMYSKLGDSGAMICALMPKEIITKQADGIMALTLVIVITACVVAVLIGIFISSGMANTIKNINIKLKEAAKGDLTVEFSTKSKDEFKILVEEIQNTFIIMKKLIHQVKELSSEVSNSSVNVTQTSTVFLKSTEKISAAMNEIEQGIVQQATDAEECLVQMENLSKKIILVSDNTKEIEQIAEITKSNIVEGTNSTEDLNKQTQSTIEITTDIISKIENLEQSSLTISNITNVINEIANQTQLLSLNASIEAARAGTFGRGFTVVAEEISKLSAQSKDAVSRIKNMISKIQLDTEDAVKTARSAEAVLKKQEIVVRNTTSSYHNINQSVEQLMICLRGVTENVNNIEEARVSTLSSIENISAVLEEVAASSSTVNETSNNQITSVQILNRSATELNENANELLVAVNKFFV